MKAVVHDKRNSPDVLVLRDVEKPVPTDGQVLVKVYAASVNAADYRSMKLGIIPKSRVFGADMAGCVEAVGRNVRGFAAGDRVFGDILAHGSGGFGEYVAVPETALARIPDGMSFETAAAIPMAATTALQALRDKGGLKKGQAVLIVGAGGGVGHFAVQLARHFGANVTAVCGEKNAPIVKTLGAERVIDYTKEDFTQTEARYDMILGLNGSHSLLTYRRLLVPGGIYVMVGGAISQVIQALLFGAILSIGSKKMQYLVAKADVKDLELLARLVQDGTIRPVIDRRYPLSETAAAMRYMSEGHAQGKVIIEVA